MNSIGFPTPRVVIVDDKIEEAWPIAEAFSRLDIPTAWYKGTGGDDFPKAPLQGVRLLVLDLVLNPPNFEASWAAGAVFNTVAPTLISGPFVLVLWTAHPDDRSSFERALEKYNAPLPELEKVIPLAVIELNKSDFVLPAFNQTEGSPSPEAEVKFDASALLGEVQEVLNMFSPFDILFHWESSCAEAATRSVSRISALALNCAEMKTEQWGHKIGELMDWLAEASGGKIVTQKRESRPYIGALYESLTMVHDDAIRSLSFTQDGTMLQATDPLQDLGDDTVRAALNSVILTSLEESGEVPGAVIHLETVQLAELPFHANAEMKPYRKFVQSFFGPNYSSIRDVIFDECAPVIIEVSPGCDFAQQKRKRFRFVTGLILPSRFNDSLLNRADFIKIIGPIMYNAAISTLVVDSLHFFSTPLDSSLGLPSPLFRLRNHVLVDIQAWLGSHLSRPGHLSI